MGIDFGIDASEFTGVEPTEESWELGDEDDPSFPRSPVWRELTAPAPGDYEVAVTAGGQTTSVTWTVVGEP